MDIKKAFRTYYDAAHEAAVALDKARSDISTWPEDAELAILAQKNAAKSALRVGFLVLSDFHQKDADELAADLAEFKKDAGL